MSADLFIAGDWGTSRLRLSLIRGDQVLARAEGPGIGQTPDPATVLAAATADWPETTPVILSGMVGSQIGWVEAPYLDCPARTEDLARAMVRFRSGHRDIAIAPGLACRNLSDAPDVMRGEETQILGAMALDPRLRTGRHLLALPGTHSKWARLEDGAVIDFQTSVSGELFAALRDHTVLGRGLEGLDPTDAEGFRLGLDRALDGPHPSLPHLLFEVRSRRLRDDLSPAAALAALSGMVIGADVAGAAAGVPDLPVTLVGAPGLTAGYAQALERLGRSVQTLDGDAAALTGLRRLRQALDQLGDTGR